MSRRIPQNCTSSFIVQLAIDVLTITSEANLIDQSLIQVSNKKINYCDREGLSSILTLAKISFFANLKKLIEFDSHLGKKKFFANFNFKKILRTFCEAIE